MKPITNEINFTQYTAAANGYNAPDGDMTAICIGKSKAYLQGFEVSIRQGNGREDNIRAI